MLEERLEALKTELQTISPELITLFNPPATPALIAQAEAAVGRSFPAELRALYQIHNGQKQGAGLFFDWPFLTLEEMVQEWTLWSKMDEMYRLDFDVDAISVPRGYIKEMYVSPAWLPIAKDYGGNHYAIDLDPAAKGQVGQVIVFGRDYDYKYVLANSLAELFDYYTERLKTAEYDFEEGGSIYIDPPQVQEPSAAYGSAQWPQSGQSTAYDDVAAWQQSLSPAWQKALRDILENVTDFNQLNTIYHLSLLRAPINDLTPVTMFTELRELIASVTPIRSVEPLAALPYLKKVVLGNTPLETLDGLQMCYNLANLSLSGSKVSDLSPLAGLPNLKKLNISGTPVASLDSIANLTHLIALDVARTAITSLAAINGFPTLLRLNISQTTITDLSILPTFPRLSAIDISDLAITDFSPLAACQNIATIACTYDQFLILKDRLPYKPNISIVGEMTDDQKEIWRDYLNP
ncbi:MAG: SMI1/KNR4 family protein [Anaerolineae bacterium]|nr:SMI1/KNR4 family protein [Anaerolineae bacterium]